MLYLWSIAGKEVATKPIEMNLVSGNSAKKEHWSSGAKTACNRKMSIGKNDTESFRWVLTNYPEMCCHKCVSEFTRLKK